MRTRRGGWLGGCGSGVAAVVLAAAVAPTAHAQPGFGPDPFWPYNNQYSPYTMPIGPASPMGGGNEMWMRAGVRGANQFQDYLAGLPGAGRLTSDRAGIGMPGYRSAVDPSWKGGEYRTYQPNFNTTPTLRETRQQVADTYLAYFSERDPKKRTELLKELHQVRRQYDRFLDNRSPTPSRVLESATGAARGSAMRRSPGSAEETYRSGRSASPARTGGGSARPLPPPPPVPAGGSPRAGGGRSRTSPSRVLDRASGMDDRRTSTPGSTSSSPRTRRAPRPSSPLPSSSSPEG